MSQTVTRSAPIPFTLTGRSREANRIGTLPAAAWRRSMFWPAEFLRLIGVAFLFPVVILAVGVPIAVALSALLLAGQWLLQSLS